LTLLFVLAGLGVVVVVLAIWAGQAAGPTSEAVAALNSDSSVTVTDGDLLVFEPTGHRAPIGLILYPGARIDPRAYAQLGRAIAEQGFLTVIAPMPLNLAILAPDAARDIMERFPDVDSWVVGGHSLGGAMAARFAYENPGLADGLILWAAYPADFLELLTAPD
jgi:pimeloyl-ACP methyl ester carboxylesterase